MITVEAVAARAGVGKPTIYRYWANAQELAMAAIISRLASMEEAHYPTSIPQSASPLDDLRRQVQWIIRGSSSHEGNQIMKMLASVEHSGELFEAFRDQVVLDHRSESLSILRRAVAVGQIRTDAPLEEAVDLLHGAIFFRLVSSHAPVTPEFGERAVDIIIQGLAEVEK